MYDLWSVDVPMQRWPIANWLLIAFIIVVSIFAWSMTEPQDTRRLEQLFAELTQPGPIEGKDKVERVHELQREIERLSVKNSVPGTLHPHHFHFYQLVTSILVHANASHLIGNMFFLFIFGNAINARFGHGWYLLCFFGI